MKKKIYFCVEWFIGIRVGESKYLVYIPASLCFLFSISLHSSGDSTTWQSRKMRKKFQFINRKKCMIFIPLLHSINSTDYFMPIREQTHTHTHTMANSCWCSDILYKVLSTFYSTVYDLLLFFGSRLLILPRPSSTAWDKVLAKANVLLFKHQTLFIRLKPNSKNQTEPNRTKPILMHSFKIYGSSCSFDYCCFRYTQVFT